ncbi:hypothetical protein [Phytohabitans kaempferiae]|uniref:Immunity protein 35 domain-containing protein n=1 Tax=Phytohabitans kaempferiae TaxID=1620943 RepID=A0ABV6LUL2_9ACTN
MSRTDLVAALASISGGAFGDRDYVGYFVNQHGEQLVFVQRSGEAQAVLLHSDLGWEPLRISPDMFRIGIEGVSESSAFARVPIIGDVILNQPEALWLTACFQASAWLRDG